MLLQNLFFPPLCQLLSVDIYSDQCWKRNRPKRARSRDLLLFFPKSQTHWKICAKFLVFVIKHDKK